MIMIFNKNDHLLQKIVNKERLETRDQNNVLIIYRVSHIILDRL